MTVAGGLDYETATSHDITIRATSSDGSFATEVFTISVTDVNESGVSAISDTDARGRFRAGECGPRTVVGITAFADDADGTDTVSYSLDDDAGGRFAIDANTGVVTVAGGIDREAAASYDITVRATSSDTSSTTRTFTIAVGDVDEFDTGAVTNSSASPTAIVNAPGGAARVAAGGTDGDVVTGGRLAIDPAGHRHFAGAPSRLQTDHPRRRRASSLPYRCRPPSSAKAVTPTTDPGAEFSTTKCSCRVGQLSA